MAVYLRALLASIVCLNLVGSARVQDSAKPTPQQNHLQRLVGNWDAQSDFGKGTMTYQMGVGGLWLIGDFTGEFGGMKYQGKSLETYDPATKKFRSVWIDSFTTSPRIMEGNLDKDAQVLTLTGEGRGGDGKSAKFKSITAIKDANTINYSRFMVDP
jgi:hypothetical protein